MIINPNFHYSVTHPFIALSNVFTSDECDLISEIGNRLPMVDSVVGGEKPTHTQHRQSTNSFMEPNSETEWIFNRIIEASTFVNERYFQYDLYGFSFLQYTEYCDKLDHYNWHMDIDPLRDVQSGHIALTRKLSASVILSDPSEYEGGDLEMYINLDTTAEHTVAQEKGGVIFFPSYAMHRVTPVSDGLRKSLVVWIEGPRFK
jgi:PKHD-type hydroxylase